MDLIIHWGRWSLNNYFLGLVITSKKEKNRARVQQGGGDFEAETEGWERVGRGLCGGRVLLDSGGSTGPRPGPRAGKECGEFQKLPLRLKQSM